LDPKAVAKCRPQAEAILKLADVEPPGMDDEIVDTGTAVSFGLINVELR